MANTYSARLAVLFDLVFQQGQLGTIKPQLSFNQALAQGTSTWQFNKLLIQERTVVTGTPDVLNLSDGSLKEPSGGSLVFTKIMAWGIINEDATNSLTVGNNGTNPWEGWISAGGTKKIHLGGVFADASSSGYAVGTGATDRLKVVADAGTITYAICMLGQG
jgi:hypothetical protein